MSVKPEWQFRRETFYALNGNSFTDRTDVVTDIKVIERWDPSEIVNDAINYSIIHTDEMYYPGKSYMIAVQYASWIQDYFGGDVLELLNDPNLLPDDPYFKVYSESPEIYNKILAFADRHGSQMSPELPYMQMTYQYFLQEFMLDAVGQSILPYISKTNSI